MNHIALPYISRQNKIETLAPLLQLPWAMLLDSAGDDLDYNRYDIFSFQPTVSLSFKNKLTHINSQTNHSDLDLTSPLDCMRTLLDIYKPAINLSSEIPFTGGWLGYISYDFGRYLEELPSIASDDIDLPQLQMGLYQWAMITDHKKKQTRLHNFGLDESSWWNIVNQFVGLDNSQKFQSEPFNLTSPWQSNTTEKQYRRAFNIIQDYIHCGDCYQVNYAQRFTTNYQGSILSAYQKLTQSNQAPFSAFLNFEDHQILSLSPERFIEVHQKNVKTQPIKGTRPRSQNPIEDQVLADELINSDKDRAENLMIVDLLRNDLSRTANKASVNVTELFGHYRFASVHHLISTIESKLAPEYDNFDLLATTLPGGSITGAPKIRAMEIIEELEPVRRNIYCGIIGYIDFAGNMDSNICIRTLVAKDNKLHCWAGGGLVADSEATSEYKETFDKLAKILPVLSEEA